LTDFVREWLDSVKREWDRCRFLSRRRQAIEKKKSGGQYVGERRGEERRDTQKEEKREERERER